MVAPKKGRGAKAQATKAKPVEEQTQEVEMTEVEQGGNNGVTEHMDESEENITTADTSDQQIAGESDQPESSQDQSQLEAAANTEDPKPEDKIEPGKLLVENLPSSYLFDYQEKLKEIFSQYGEITSVKRGPIIVTELTTTPTLSAIVEFKNKDSLEQALSEQGRVVDGTVISVAIESRAETTVLVGVPFEANTEYVRLLFNQCGEVAHIHEFSKTKYKILRVTFHNKESVERALKLDRELRINGFLVTVSKYRDEEEQKAHAANINKNKRANNQLNKSGTAASGVAGGPVAASSPANNRSPGFRTRGTYNSRANYRGGRGRGGFGARGGGYPRGGYAPVNAMYSPHGGYMARPGGFMNDGQRPNKRVRQ